jgi:hypothetical protein|tara:strand:- start:268 stop:855 length:588 start_codon:yes stop_codon:yes gene_type:complete
MGIMSRAADLGYAFRFLKLLVTPWEKLEAFKLGIVDKRGRNIKKAKELETNEEKSAYTIFHRLVFNIKRLLQMVPGGKSKFGSFAAALFLIKEHTGMSEKKIKEMLEKALDSEFENDITESTWFIKEGYLNPGTYVLTKDMVSPSTGEPIAKTNSKVIVNDFTAPSDSVWGVNIYEVKHISTNQKLYITNEDIKR